MANLLNFNSTRDLGFYHVRDLQFDLNRSLDFDLNRELVFNPNRDLGFGKKGVLFRGYVCVKCDAIVSVDATSCDECGAVFEQPKVVGVMKATAAETPDFDRKTSRAAADVEEPRRPRVPEARPPAPPMRVAPPAKSVTVPPASATAPSTAPPGSASRFCPNCGARSWQGDAFCWNCGARFTGANPVTPSTEKIQLPSKKVKKVAKDWQETGQTWQETAEEK